MESTQVSRSYDVVIAGASLGGLSTAIHAAKRGAKVLAFDPKDDLGHFACAEGCLSDHLVRAGFPPEPAWAPHIFRTVEFISPDGTNASITAKYKNGIILDRYKFQNELARKAEKLGVEVRRGRGAGKLDLAGGTLEIMPAGTGPGGRGVRAPKKSAAETVAATTFVDATGIHCFLGKQVEPSYGVFDRKDFAPVLQRTLMAAGPKEDRISLWFGSPYAPEGYAWIFPKGDRVYNVGIGSLSRTAKTYSMKDNLQKFIDEKVGKVEKELYQVGSRLPLAMPNDPPVFSKEGHHLLLVGDAARLCVPTVGAGIAPALLSGRWAGENWDDPRRYEKILKKQLYGTLRRAYKVKNDNITDAGLNKIMRTVRKTLWLHKMFPGLVEEYAFSGIRIT